MALKFSTDLGSLSRLRDALAFKVRRGVFDLFMRERAPGPESRVADTFLPFLHWLPDATYRSVLRKLGHDYCAEIENLNLLDSTSFLALFPAARRNRLRKTGVPLPPTNLVCISLASGA